jgi:hypothetical protein
MAHAYVGLHPLALAVQIPRSPAARDAYQLSLSYNSDGWIDVADEEVGTFQLCLQHPINMQHLTI